ncbi:MAG TPA: twin-arginine translocase TatA/TatE family subunit [Mycobacteriales bacterium]|jgi:sec-independent protein translocase protein TatA|nr:twin-arginine translocase TatA/TatE family subunit [Mycobacteriales bacterium]
MLVGPGKWVVLLVLVLLFVSYRKLPDMSRSIGRSLRIFKGELKGLAENDVRTKAAAPTVRGPLGTPGAGDTANTNTAGTDSTATGSTGTDAGIKNDD